MRPSPKFWAKVKSLAVVTTGGVVLFSLSSIYRGNENFYDNVLMPILHTINPETSHKVAVAAAKYNLLPKSLYQDPDCLKTNLWGLKFSNPVGVAAGFDKQGEAIEALHKIGFGFVEIGSVTPFPQPGNCKPRVFRLKADSAIINRYGFNSDGHDVVLQRLKTLKNKNFEGIIGVNLGKNKNSADPIKDYVSGIEKFGEVADYFVINVSSPNTPGLREWQRKGQLRELLSALVKAKNALPNKKKPPILVKLAPDLSDKERRDISDVILHDKGCQIDGLVISNTTVNRPDLISPLGDEEGGLSGKPLHPLSTKLISDMYAYTNGTVPIIGVGGIFTGQDAYEKIRAGASLIQIYTGFAYHGPPRVLRIKRELDELLRMDVNIKRKHMEGFVGLHLGAGNHSIRYHTDYLKLCRKACKKAKQLLNDEKPALSVAETVTALLEDSPFTNAGFGSTLNWEGKVECDASIMDGLTLRWGGVGAVPNVRNPICLARTLCERQGTISPYGRIPPCLLVGTGAEKWAKWCGVGVVDPDSLVSERARRQYRKYRKRIEDSEDFFGKDLCALDTVGVICLDKAGNVAAACSSGGIALKHTGRVGQAAAYGSGVWAENGDFGSIAVCTTGCGEYIMRTMLSKEISLDVRSSESPTLALHNCMKNKFLDSPFLSGLVEKLGGAAVLRVTPTGLGEFTWAHTTNTMCIGFMSTGDSKPVARISYLPPGKTAGQNVVAEGTPFTAKLCEMTEDEYFVDFN